MKALKYSKNPRGNKIRVEIVDLAKERFSIFFSDNAPDGLDPKDDFAFEKRISRTANKDQGKGLGLYSLKQMLIMLNGDLKIVKPQLGSGTTLRVILPKKFIWTG